MSNNQPQILTLLAILAIAIAFGILVMTLTGFCHDVNLDEDGGHFYDDLGVYHFHNKDGTYELNVGESYDPFIGPWIYTAIPGFDTPDERGCKRTVKDAFSIYTGGEVKEEKLLVDDIEDALPSSSKHNLVWNVGFIAPYSRDSISKLVDDSPDLWVNRNPYFYGIFTFTANQASKATIHFGYSSYDSSVRAWFNGKEAYRTACQENIYSALVVNEKLINEDAFPFIAQVMIREGKNTIVVKSGLYDRDWWFQCGIIPHNPLTQIEVNILYREGKVVGPKTIRWANLKARTH